MDNKPFKSGFVSLIGRPNVGKSTLLNQLVGQKIAIMSDKPQTTRNKIQGVLTNETMQIVFLDTPGIHKPKSKLGTFMLQAAESALGEVDVILFLIDVVEGLGGGDRYIIERLKAVDTPVYLILNKIDRVHPEDLLPIIAAYNPLYDFAHIIPVSALNGNNTSALLAQIEEDLPEGPQYYPEDQVTDHPEQFICAELIREKILHHTREEIPHSVAVYIEEMKAEDHGVVHIGAVIVVERDSQKGIIIGKGGAMLKTIGQEARQDMERLLGSKIFLNLWVKVQKGWRNHERALNELGFRHE